MVLADVENRFLCRAPDPGRPPGDSNDLVRRRRVDGATMWQRFWHITLPLLKPALLLALLFRTMDAFRVFDLVFVMTQGGPGDATQVPQFYGYQTLHRRSDRLWIGRIGCDLPDDSGPVAGLPSRHRLEPPGEKRT